MGVDFSAIRSTTLLGRALRFPLRLIPKRARLPILQGAHRGSTWIVGAGTHGCWLGSYEHEKRKRIERTLRPGDVFYDIGANSGYYTLLASRLVGGTGRVVAFEPLPKNLDHLRTHLRLNRVTNTTVVAAAVAEADGTARFEPAGDAFLGRLDPEGPLEVRTVGLDALVNRGEVPPPRVIKIDVEGGEVAVLRGASDVLRRHRPVVFLATHGPRAHETSLSILAAAGYKTAGLGGEAVNETDEILAVPGES